LSKKYHILAHILVDTSIVLTFAVAIYKQSHNSQFFN